MANLDYARQKLYQAVSSLVCDDRPLTQRLCGAFLIFYTLQAEDFPDDLQANFMAIEAPLAAVLTSIPGHPSEGTLKIEIDTLSDREGGAMITALVSLCDQVARRLRC